MNQKYNFTFSRRLRRSLVLLLVQTVLVLLLAGCGAPPREDPPKASLNSRTDVTGYEFELLGEPEEGWKNVYVIVKDCSSVHCRQLIRGIAAAAEGRECNLYVAGTENESDTEGQMRLLEIASEKNADAVILAPVNSTVLRSRAASLYSREIPVILVDNILDGQAYNVCYMTDNTTAGMMAAEKLYELIRKQGVGWEESITVGIAVANSESQTMMGRVKGFCMWWTDHAPSTWKISDEILFDYGSEAAAGENCRAFIKEYPDLKGLCTLSETATRETLRVLKENENKDIALMGVNWFPELEGVIREGEFPAAAIIQSPYEMGYRGMESAWTLLSGELLPAQKYYNLDVYIVDHESFEDGTGDEIIRKTYQQDQ